MGHLVKSVQEESRVLTNANRAVYDTLVVQVFTHGALVSASTRNNKSTCNRMFVCLFVAGQLIGSWTLLTGQAE